MQYLQQETLEIQQQQNQQKEKIKNLEKYLCQKIKDRFIWQGISQKHIIDEFKLFFNQCFTFLMQNKQENNFVDPPNQKPISHQEYLQRYNYIFEMIQLFAFPKKRDKVEEDLVRLNREIINYKQLEIFKYGSIFDYCLNIMQFFVEDLIQDEKFIYKLPFYTYFQVIYFEFGYFNQKIYTYFHKPVVVIESNEEEIFDESKSVSQFY